MAIIKMLVHCPFGMHLCLFSVQAAVDKHVDPFEAMLPRHLPMPSPHHHGRQSMLDRGL